MYIFLMAIHVVISIALVMVILAQSSKGGALDGLVGGTASTMLGSHGASAFLSKWTKIIGGVWIVSSLFLAINVRQMTAPQRARALERLRSSEETTQQPADMETVFPTEEPAPGEVEAMPGETPPAEPVEVEVLPGTPGEEPDPE